MCPAARGEAFARYFEEAALRSRKEWVLDVHLRGCVSCVGGWVRSRAVGRSGARKGVCVISGVG